MEVPFGTLDLLLLDGKRMKAQGTKAEIAWSKNACVSHHKSSQQMLVYAECIDDAVHLPIRVGQQRPQAVVDLLLLRLLLSLLKRNTHA
jgi:hypothetical protein